MKRLSSLVFLIFATALGCNAEWNYRGDGWYAFAGYVTRYFTSLTVERPSDKSFVKRCGEQRIKNIEGLSLYDGEKCESVSFEDSLVKVTWTPKVDEFKFTLENKSENSIKIIWDEGAFVTGNMSSPVVHEGVKYAEKDNSKPPTTIPKGAMISDKVVPTDKIYYLSAKDNVFGDKGWRIKPILPDIGDTEKKLKADANEFVGTTLKILLPLSIEGVTREYNFVFKIDSVYVVNPTTGVLRQR